MLMMGMWVGTYLHLHLRQSPPPRGMQGHTAKSHHNNVSMTTHNTCMHEGAKWCHPLSLGPPRRKTAVHGRPNHTGSECIPVPTHLPSPSRGVGNWVILLRSLSDALSTIVLRSRIGINSVALSMAYTAALLAPAWVPSSSAQMSSP